MKYIITLLFICLVGGVSAQVSQIGIERIDQMPNLPSPFLMRDWDQVALGYDSLVFNTERTGEYWPLVSIGGAGVNFPDINRIQMQSYVGWTGTHGEGINVIPAIVGATLVGIDKSAQNGVNWAENAKDYFNLANGQNLYLNGSSTGTGGDWWYETMPNVFFYQMYDLYPNEADFGEQFRIVADRWLEAVVAMGGNATPWQVPEMNYRAWNFSNMTGLASGVKEPEAAGAIAWILYHAYLKLDDVKYLHGAKQALDFLNEWQDNPSYELQLPYGVLTAAKLNANLGANYDLDKMINWCFDRGALRGWGTIVGTWDNKDISGIIGEANDQGNDYAFVMNGYQHVAALGPMVKYDKRYAKAIAKWILNVANASRFFYANFLAENHQSDFIWSQTYDPNSYIAYESLKEAWEGKALYARGDSKTAGWAETNLGLYGSSHVGYLAAVVDQTDVQGILDLDLNATDFLSSRDYPVHLVYNPQPTAQQVTIKVGNNSIDLYDAINEQVIKSGVSGEVLLDINANDVFLLTYLPSGTELIEIEGKLWAGNIIVDYHYGYDFSQHLTFKALAAKNTIGELGVNNPIYATVESNSQSITYEWSLNGVIQEGSTTAIFDWTANALGNFTIHCTASTSTESVEESIIIEVVDVIPFPPIINGYQSDKTWYQPNEIANVVCLATDPKNLALSYEWSVEEGEIIATNGNEISYKIPNSQGVYKLTCEVVNSSALSNTSDHFIFSTTPLTTTVDSILYFPFSGTTDAYGPVPYSILDNGITYEEDAKGKDHSAMKMNLNSDFVIVRNQAELLFDQEITVAFWLSLSSNTNSEQFVVSHGSWQNRWKISITPGSKLRWTLNTSTGIKDLDTEFPLSLNQYYHIACVFNGEAMVIYIDGVLHNFVEQNGILNSTSYDLAIGRQYPDDDNYTLNGLVDELKIYDMGLDPNMVALLPTIWADDLNSIPTSLEERSHELSIYPNPTKGKVTLVNSGSHPIEILNIYNLLGNKIHLELNSVEYSGKRQILDFSQVPSGIYYVHLLSQNKPQRLKILVTK